MFLLLVGLPSRWSSRAKRMVGQCAQHNLDTRQHRDQQRTVATRIWCKGSFASPLSLFLLARPSRLKARQRQAHCRSCRRQAGMEDPWSILGLAQPVAAGAGSVDIAEVRRAFREAAKRTHPDTPGGSDAAFRRVAQAFQAITESRNMEKDVLEGVDVAVAEDPELAKWWAEARHRVGDWGSFEAIESVTDDDDWGGREPLKNFFVTRHDATQEGIVGEGTIAIYRLSEISGGLSWGVGRVLAMQIKYSIHGPNGVIHLQPLMLGESTDAHETKLVEDVAADVVTVRAIDRFEVVDCGLVEQLDGSVTVWPGSLAYSRVVASGMVYLDGADWNYE